MASAHLFVALNYGAYYPGKPVDGYAVVVVRNPITVKSLTLQMRGVEMVSWYQGVTQKEHCHGLMEIFHEDIILAGGDDQDLLFLDPNTYTYPFEWMLPDNVPASYEEAKSSTGGIFQNFSIPENGIIPKSFGDEKSSIRYFCSVKLETVIEEVVEEEVKARIIRLEKSLYFKVVEAFDPAILVQKAKKVQLKKSFMLSGDPVEVRVALANGGVLFTGQNLFLHVFVNNGSSRRVERITMRLDEHIAFTAPDANQVEQLFHRKETVLHARVEDSVVRTKGTFDRDLMFPVPASITGTLHCAKHISRQYELVVDVEMQLNGKVTVTLPVLLLQWTPLIKNDVPDVVPIKISKRRTAKTDPEENADPEENDDPDEIHPENAQPVEIEESIEGVETIEPIEIVSNITEEVENTGTGEIVENTETGEIVENTGTEETV